MEGAEFEIITDNQVLKHFFNAEDINRREARLLGTLSKFGFIPITLKIWSIPVLGYIPSRARHSTKRADLQNISCSTADITRQDSFRELLQEDPKFDAVMKKIHKGKNDESYHYHDAILRLATLELCMS